MKVIPRTTLARGAALALVLVGAGGLTGVLAAANAVTFPVVDQLKHYATVTRGVTLEHMLTSQEALTAIQGGRPVPVGTHVVLVDYQSGKLYRYLVSQKVGSGEGDWQYQWFWPNGSVKPDEKPDQCYACHRSRIDRQFMFTHTDAVRFGK